MKEIRKILLGIDLLESTANVIEAGGNLARTFGAELVLLHVEDEIPTHFSVETAAALVEEITKRMNGIASTLRSDGVSVADPIIGDGHADHVILSTATEVSADLIVIGASRKSFIEKILGSHAEKIIRTATQPVWLIHTDDIVKSIRKVLCATDCSPSSAETLIGAASIARKFNAQLQILHVFDYSQYLPQVPNLSAPIGGWDIEPPPYLDIPEERSIDMIAQETKKLNLYVEKYDLSNIEYSCEVAPGNPPRVIIEVASQIHADLIVIGASHRSTISYLFAPSTTGKIARSCRAPLVTIGHQSGS